MFVSQTAPPKLTQRENGVVKHSIWFSPSEALKFQSQCWLWDSTRNVPVCLPDSAPTLTSEVVAPWIVSKLKYIKTIYRIELQKLSRKLSPLCYKAQSHSSLCSTECCQTCTALTAATMFIFQRRHSQSPPQTPLADTSCYPLQGEWVTLICSHRGMLKGNEAMQFAHCHTASLSVAWSSYHSNTSVLVSKQ